MTFARPPPRARKNTAGRGILATLTSRSLSWVVVCSMVVALLYENQTSVVMLESSSRPCLPPKQTEALPGNPLERGGSETIQSREQTSEPERRVVSLTEPPPAAADDPVDNRDAVGDATTPPPIVEITWILPRDLDRFKDVFAASWWQTMSRFMPLAHRRSAGSCFLSSIECG
jgi:hypothetical protein